MGLDLLEFTVAIEDAFGIFIPDPDATRLSTPRQLVDYLQARTRHGQPAACLEQRAFYQLRRAGMRVLDRPRDAFWPDASWADLLHPQHHARQWQLLGKVMGISPWPRLKPILTWGPTGQTVGQTAHTLAITAANALLGPNEGWNRLAIEGLVRSHMAEELGVVEFQWDDQFIRDLGCG